MHRLFRYLCYSTLPFLLLGIALYGLYRSLPNWLPAAVDASLPAGWELLELRFEQPTMAHWDIHRLQLRYTDSNSEQQADTDWQLPNREQLPSALFPMLAGYRISIRELGLQSPLENGLLVFAGKLDFAQQSLSIDGTARLAERSMQLGLQVDATNTVRVEVAADSLQFQATVEPESADSLQRLIFSLQGKAPRFDSDSLAGKDLDLQLSGLADIGGEELAIRLDEGSRFIVNQARALHYKTRRWRFKLREDARIRLTSQGPQIDQLRFTSNNFAIQSDSFTTPRIRISGNLELHDDLATGTLHLASRIPEFAEQITVSSPFRHRLSTQAGSARLYSYKASFSEAQAFLPFIVPDWPLPFDLSEGQASLGGRVSWSLPAFNAQLELALQELGGFYQEYLFTGSNGTVKIALDEGQLAASVDTLSIAELDVGTPIQNLALSVVYRNDQLSISGLRAEVLGARIQATPFSTSLSEPAFTGTVSIDGLDLSQALELEQGIYGSGTLDGSLPIQVSGTGLQVNDGRLQARSPGGVIRYTGDVPAAALQSAPQLQLAVDALRNFQYKVLDITAAYAENGSLSLAARLEGRNPEMESGRPVHFNLNITENVPALMQSLQISRQLSEQLERRIGDALQE